jgi:uncharacterized coiled-coil protein SlyX
MQRTLTTHIGVTELGAKALKTFVRRYDSWSTEAVGQLNSRLNEQGTELAEMKETIATLRIALVQKGDELQNQITGLMQLLEDRFAEQQKELEGRIAGPSEGTEQKPPHKAAKRPAKSQGNRPTGDASTSNPETQDPGTLGTRESLEE